MERTKALLFGAALVAGVLLYGLVIAFVLGFDNIYSPIVWVASLLLAAFGIAIYLDIKEMRR